MKRRALFGFLGVSPVAVAGAAVASQAEKEGAPPEDQTPGWTMVPSRPEPLTVRIKSLLRLDRSRQLEIDVGADGHLWIRPKGKDWQRVVTA